jgi:hypothetical protein
MRRPAATSAADPRRAGWQRQPVLWLGLLVFVAALAGCVWIIVASHRHADTPLPTARTVFGVPLSAAPEPGGEAAR